MRVLQTALVTVFLGLILAATLGGRSYLLSRDVPMAIEGWRSRYWRAVAGVLMGRTDSGTRQIHDDVGIIKSSEVAQ
jgi:hypothetical protein